MKILLAFVLAMTGLGANCATKQPLHECQAGLNWFPPLAIQFPASSTAPQASAEHRPIVVNIRH
jgi:hypothetical protein